MPVRALAPSLGTCLITLCLLLGCGTKPAARFDAVVSVESDPGSPVAGALLSRDGQALGATDANGLKSLELTGAPGERVTLRVACPSGYRSPDQPVTLVLRTLLEGRKPVYRTRCPPLLRSLVVAVRAQNAAHLPVRYLGREIARTDASGACHALLKLAAGESATLTLDTSAPEHARLLPRNPALKLVVPDRDELLVFDQSFTLEPEKARPRARREPTGPTRI